MAGGLIAAVSVSDQTYSAIMTRVQQLGGRWLAALGIAGAILTSVKAAEPTALQLAKEGNRYIGEQSKDKVVQIRSEKSIGSLVPNIWFVVYYDPTATFKAVEVKFGGGKMLD